MPLTLPELCTLLKPSSTALLLGAGAAVPSGAPSGKLLAQRLWREVGRTEPQSEDLIETATILERRYDRKSVVDAIRSSLKDLTPTGGLQGLPKLGWRSLFSTNFDQVLEKAYKQSATSLVVVRSNYDFTNKESQGGTHLYKLHGCISQDRAWGDKPSMIVSEQDYEDFAEYRQSLFTLLKLAMLTGDVLVVGQSLRDPHLAELVKHVLSLKDQGAQGQVYCLIYERDDLRAPLLEDRGARICFAGIDQLVHGLATSLEEADTQMSEQAGLLPVGLVSTVFQVSHASELEPNTIRMFNGGPATYGDIRTGSTFERGQLEGVVELLRTGAHSVVAIIGAAGVGKTTFTRQMLVKLQSSGVVAYEHKRDFTLDSKPWISFEGELASAGRRAVLLVDECTRHLRQVNLLAEHLAAQKAPALSLLLTGNAAQWAPRIKSPAIFSSGKVFTLSRLVDADLHSLINLLAHNRKIAELVHSSFRNLSRPVQFARLRERCSADMFVCLNNIFANDSLDQILLTEYDELPETAQEHYRYVAALESAGMRVHRQLIVRMLGIRADQIGSVLTGLEGIVDEFDIKPREGIFGWATRHLVIARKITEYKFSSLEEQENLFNRIIENVNPAVPTELQSIRDLCDVEFGIGRLGDRQTRVRLYRALIKLVPGERIPWHRLIWEHLEADDLEGVEYLLRDAVEAVGADAPIDRYRVRLLLARAELTPGISLGDRLALTRKAFDVAEKNIARHKYDKHSYRSLCDVAIKLVERGENLHVLDQAIDKMRAGAEAILDPEVDNDIRHYESIRLRLA